MSKLEVSYDTHGSWIWKDPTIREPNVIVFIHGYTGSPESTWMKFPSFIRQTGEGFDSGFEIASFGYETHLLANFQTVETVAGLFLTFLAAHTNDAKRLFLVCHSLGGLVARAALASERADQSHPIQRVRQVHFLGVPHRGVHSRLLERLLSIPLLRRFNPLAASVHPRNPDVKAINSSWDRLLLDTIGHQRHLRIFNYVGNRDWLVPPDESSQQSSNKVETQIVDATHLDISKPHSTENPLYLLVKRRILEDRVTNEESEGASGMERGNSASLPTALSGYRVAFSALARTALETLSLSEDHILGILADEVTSHPILLRTDYDMAPRPLKHGLFITLTKRGKDLTIHAVRQTPLAEPVQTTWNEVCNIYMEAYQLPFRLDSTRLLIRNEYVRTTEILGRLLASLSSHLYGSRIYYHGVFSTLHRLKGTAEAAFLEAERLYADFENDAEAGAHQLGQVAIRFDLVVSSVHKILSEYPPPR